MVHSAFLRTSVASGFGADRPAALPFSAWLPLDPAKRALRHLNAWMGSGYRPERHYMRGGRTPGAKSLARR